MTEEIKMEGFFIGAEETEEMNEMYKHSERVLLDLQHDIHLAFKQKDMKRMSLLIYHQMVTHFAAIILTDVMLDGRCKEERVEEILRCLKADLTDTMRRMGGDLN